MLKGFKYAEIDIPVPVFYDSFKNLNVDNEEIPNSPDNTSGILYGNSTLDTEITAAEI